MLACRTRSRLCNEIVGAALGRGRERPKENKTQKDPEEGCLEIQVSTVNFRMTWRGTSPAVQWLGLCISSTGALRSIPGWGTNIPPATWCDQTKQKNPRFKKIQLKNNYLGEAQREGSTPKLPGPPDWLAKKPPASSLLSSPKPATTPRTPGNSQRLASRTQQLGVTALGGTPT